MPPGTYILKYVAGKTWCGRTLLFGNKVAERARTPLVFDKPDFGFEGQTVTLYEVPRRNFETETISKDESKQHLPPLRRATAVEPQVPTKPSEAVACRANDGWLERAQSRVAAVSR